MARATSTVIINQQRIKQLTRAQIQALEMTAEALHTEVVQAQVIPFGETKKEIYKEYGVRGQFAKNGKEYKGKTKLELFIKEVLYKMKVPLLIIVIVQKGLVR